MKPHARPANPCFSSGPCAKRPGWTLQALDHALLGRSHRAKPGRAKLDEVVARSRAVLGIPKDYRLAHRAGLRHRRGRDGAVVAARRARRRCADLGELRRRLGDRRGQAAQARRCPRRQGAEYGSIPDLAKVDTDRDVVFTWNGTTSGVLRAERRLDQAEPRRGSPSAMRPRRPSPWRCPGTSSMSLPGRGRRCWAARRRMACWR